MIPTILRAFRRRTEDNRARRKPRALAFDRLEGKQLLASSTAISGPWKVVAEDYPGAPNDRDIRATLYLNNVVYRTYSVTTSTFDEYDPRVAINASGNFAVAYMYKDGDIDISVKAYKPSSTTPILNQRAAGTDRNEYFTQADPIRITPKNQVFLAYTIAFPTRKKGVDEDVRAWRSKGNVTRTVAETTANESRAQVVAWAANGSWADVVYYTGSARKQRRITF